MRSDARRRYERDMGAAYALEFLSYHIEAPYLPGEDAAFVYDLTVDYFPKPAMRLAGWCANRGRKANPGQAAFDAPLPRLEKP